MTTLDWPGVLAGKAAGLSCRTMRLDRQPSSPDLGDCQLVQLDSMREFCQVTEIALASHSLDSGASATRDFTQWRYDEYLAAVSAGPFWWFGLARGKELGANCGIVRAGYVGRCRVNRRTYLRAHRIPRRELPAVDRHRSSGCRHITFGA
ncbi:hypothetical protein [Telmatospirillum sp.]|uniref:hypothetical protein n=1 Tax=Telmatospirillum sp. TaxID=2079197 RepID=UPI0028467242|nr:hypothetical protein [Telmatospirillum sp.]MDR3439842.1 hypothetical protein [Telmatospirillum sp.]